MRNDNGKIKRSAGFSILELLIVAAVLVALIGIGFVEGEKMVRDSRQTNYDRIAETIYVALSRQAVSLQTSGNVSKLASGATVVASSQAAASPLTLTVDGKEYKNETYSAYALYSTASGANTTDAAKLLLSGVVSDELYEGNWYVTYRVDGYGRYCAIDAVYYSPAEYEEYFNTNIIDDGSKRAGLTNRANRLSDGAKVGYYDGSSETLPALPVDILEPDEITYWIGGANASTPQIVNTEELLAPLSVYIPNGKSVSSITLTVTVKDESGQDVKKICTLAPSSGDISPAAVTDHLNDYLLFRNGGNAATADGKGTVYTIWLVLDSFNPKDGGGNLRFKENYTLAPGDNIALTLAVSIDGETPKQNANVPASATANSLFETASRIESAGESAGTANRLVCVGYGRHLQNLDAATSGMTGNLAVYQTHDIYFKETYPNDDARYHVTGDSDTNLGQWAAVYPSRTFTPINNATCLSYDGDGKEIHNLTVNATGAAGLFGTFKGTELKNITLVDPQITTTGDNAGGLAGVVENAASIADCRLYLTRDGVENGASLLTGNNANSITGITAAKDVGGLVGSTNSTLKIDDSFAATVVKGGTYAGGLVGKAGDALTVSASYSDCYVGGTNVGGLAGHCAAGSAFNYCYSAGFVLGSPANAAGFALNTDSSASVSAQSYSLFNFDDPTAFAAGAVITLDSDGSVKAYPEPDKVMKAAANKYAFIQSGTVGANSYFSYGDANNSAGGAYRSVKDMIGTNGTGKVINNTYELASALNGKMTLFHDVLPSLPHHGDWLEKPQVKHTVTFDANGHGTAPAAQTVEDGGVAVRPTDPAAEGWMFDGWFTDTAFTAEYDFATSVTADITLYAKWLSRNGAYLYYNFNDDDGVLRFNSFDDDTESHEGWTLIQKSGSGEVTYNAMPWGTAGDKTMIGKKGQVKTIIFAGGYSPTSLYQWFDGFTELVTVDISLLDFSKVTSTGKMLYNCENLETIYVAPGLDLNNYTNIKSHDYMFYNCKKLRGSSGTPHPDNAGQTSDNDKTYARVDGLNGQGGYFTSVSDKSVAAAEPMSARAMPETPDVAPPELPAEQDKAGAGE